MDGRREGGRKDACSLVLMMSAANQTHLHNVISDVYACRDNDAVCASGPSCACQLLHLLIPNTDRKLAVQSQALCAFVPNLAA
jgi:hypothetical protein